MAAVRILVTACSLFAVAGGADLAWARGKQPPPPPASPDIVYMSNGSNSPASAAVRGVALSSDGLTGTDTQLAKAKAYRDYGSVVWSPDGTRYAWVEGAFGQTRSIMVGAPGAVPAVLYSAALDLDSGQPYPSDGFDMLAWGPGCSRGTSVLVFRNVIWPPGIMAIDVPEHRAPGTPRLISEQNASGFAFSPTGQHLAYRVYSTEEEVWVLPMCTTGDPVVLVEKEEIGATDTPCINPELPFDPVKNNCNPDHAIISIDWSRHGDRLALSVVTSPDPRYDWRDLKIVNLNYSLAGSEERISGHTGVWTVDLDQQFSSESSEHSPQWGPSEAGAVCQRIAFSQSSQAGRKLYLLDVNESGLGNCGINSPVLLNSKVPRALDWK